MQKSFSIFLQTLCSCLALGCGCVNSLSRPRRWSRRTSPPPRRPPHGGNTSGSPAEATPTGSPWRRRSAEACGRSSETRKQVTSSLGQEPFCKKHISLSCFSPFSVCHWLLRTAVTAASHLRNKIPMRSESSLI